MNVPVKAKHETLTYHTKAPWDIEPSAVDLMHNHRFIRSFFWSVFYRIGNECGDLFRFQRFLELLVNFQTHTVKTFNFGNVHVFIYNSGNRCY